jgi:transposase
LRYSNAADALDAWIAAARASELSSFAYSIDRDYAAVAAALRLPWSTGPLEGRINKLKLVKRQMYGLANFDLLRQRILAAA